MGFGLKRAFKKLNKTFVGKTFNPLGIGVGGPGKQWAGFIKPPEAPLPQDGSAGYGDLNNLAIEEERKRRELGQKHQQQILDFSKEFETSAGDYRNRLAQRLADTGKQTFEMSNPYILEDLHSRGFSSSPTEVANAQSNALKDIALKNQGVLTDYDNGIFSQLNDLKGTALSSLLGGDQSALDSALDLRRAGIQRQFDVADQNQQDAMAKYLAKRQSRDNLFSGLFNLGGNLLGGLF